MKNELPNGTKVKDMWAFPPDNDLKPVYTKQEDGKWTDSQQWIRYTIPDNEVGQGKRYEIVATETIKEQSNSVVSIEDAAKAYAKNKTYSFGDDFMDSIVQGSEDGFIEGAKFRDEQYSSLLSSYRELLDEISTNWDANDEGSTSNKLIKKGNAILSQFNQ